ncbi:eukaryotic translation initiation factor eif1a-like protein [Peziza echinospora]|nr:eukaryotic translation initiation factor eif1a-like protein [Peziza echinospora]
MAPRRRNLQAAAELTTSPPDVLPTHHAIAQINKAAGNNLYTCILPAPATTASSPTTPTSQILAELAPQFRSKIWLKRGGYVVIDMSAFEGRENKISGEIVNVVREEKEWRKMKYWPTEFPKSNSWNAYPGSSDEDDDEEESINNNNRVLPELRGYSDIEDEEEEVEAKTQQKVQEKEELVDSSTKSSVLAPRGGGGCLEPAL